MFRRPRKDKKTEYCSIQGGDLDGTQVILGKHRKFVRIKIRRPDGGLIPYTFRRNGRLVRVSQSIHISVLMPVLVPVEVEEVVEFTTPPQPMGRRRARKLNPNFYDDDPRHFTTGL